MLSRMNMPSHGWTTPARYRECTSQAPRRIPNAAAAYRPDHCTPMARPTLMPAAMTQGRTPRRGPKFISSRRRRRSRTRADADASAADAAGDAVASAVGADCTVASADDDVCGDDVAWAVGVVRAVASAGVGSDVVEVRFDQLARRFVTCCGRRRRKEKARRTKARSTMSSRLVREWTKCSPSTDSRPAATQAKNPERKSFQAMTPMRKIVREPMIATEKRQPKESSAPKM